VYTRAPKPAGRGQAERKSPIHLAAEEFGIPVRTPKSLRGEDEQAAFASLEADLAVVVAYGLILPKPILDAPPLGCLNLHGSLLPRWRGAAPIQRALLAGDAETGVCIMQMEAGLDTGPVLISGELSIADDDTAATLHDKLAALGAELIVDALARLPLAPCPQPDAGVTYAAKIEKAEAPLDWRLPAIQLARQVRAFNPFPGALATYQGNAIKVWGARVSDASGAPGTILAVDRNGIVVACGEGALCLLELQKAGGKRLPVAQFLAGMPLAAGAVFDLPA
jgi:methionyl-tRNA formyltransferase